MLGVGLGMGMGHAGAAGARPSLPSGSNPNLLVFPEAFDNASWVKTATIVTPNIGDPTYPTADQLTMSGAGSGFVRQVTDTAAATGASVSATLVMSTAWQVFSKTGIFDGRPYTVTAEVREPAGLGNDISIQISRSGGFLAATIFDGSGGDPTFDVHFMKLEQAAGFSGYP